MIDYPSKTLYLRTPVAGLWPKVAGEWAATRREEDGKVDPIDPKAPPRLVFRDRTLTLTDAGRQYHFGFHVGPGDGCLLVLLYPPGEELAEKLQYRSAALLKLDGGKLKLLLGVDPTKTKPAASEFTAPRPGAPACCWSSSG